MDEQTMNQPAPWGQWFAWLVALWAIPGAMTVVWLSCYAEQFGVAPCGSWPAHAINVLTLLDFAIAGAFIFRFRNHPALGLLGVLMAVAEVPVTIAIWIFGGMSVSGFYF